ncbi:MAG TPA: type IV pilus secretin PilQ [Candidatus Limnocylindrales bacterium]|nr:type IV pilus secretin PilQ [Candidatus Limnocylindrales bacterium]
MTKIWQPFRLACLAAASLLITTSALCADSGASVKVTSAVGQGVVRLDAKASGPFDYVVHHPSSDLYYIDLTGVTAKTTDTAQVLGTDIVRSYRLEQYETGATTISRLEILVGKGATPKIQREGNDELEVVVSNNHVLSANSRGANSPRLVKTALDTSAPLDPASHTAAIRQISVAKNGDAPEVLVLGSGSFQYRQLRLSKPDRLVLDFASARMEAPKKTSSTIEPIRDVRAGQFSPQVARVVIDLSKACPYSVKHVDGGIAVEFQPAAPAAPATAAVTAPSSAPAPVSEPADATPAASASTTPAADTGSSSAQPAQSSSAAPVAPAAQTFPQTTAPMSASPAQGNAEPAGFTAPVAPQTAPPAEAPAPPVAAPAAQSTTAEPAPAPPAVAPAAQSTTTEPAPAQDQSQASPPPPAAASVQNVSAPVATPASVISQESNMPGQVKYTGAPISVNLKNVDLQDFFRLIHEISGLNVVVDPNVKGSLTLVLDNVPWDQALAIVLKNNDLDEQLDGNVLRIATKATVEKEAKEAKDLAKAQVEAADLVTTTRVLSYAKATDLAATIKKFLSPRGDVLADPRTNTLIISDIPTVIPVVDNLIRELDKRSQQVEIEARVVAANRNFARDLGSQFAFAGSATGGRNLFGGANAVGTSPISRFVPPLPAPPLITGTTPPSGTSSTAVQMPLVTNLGATVPTSGVSYAFSSANFALDYIISAAEAKGVGKLLSKPKVITQNNEQATIKQGTKIPIQTVINNTISVQFVDAVLELQVTPQITAAGTIFMNIHVENTQIDPAIPRIQGIPALDTQSADTRVLVNDGTTVMIGGIIVSNQQTTIDEVPFVGSIPIVGQLFRHTSISTNSQELLFFITPRILPM